MRCRSAASSSSGFGRYKGEFGLYAFSNVKSVLLDKNSSKIEANWYPYTKTKYQLFTQMMLGLFQGGLGGFIRFALAGLKLDLIAVRPARTAGKRAEEGEPARRGAAGEAF